MEVPASAFHALKLIVQAMACGQTMALVPHDKELTTQEAADLVHVSRPHLVKLLDEGIIDHYKVGTHRRVRIEDVLDYREPRAGLRREKLDEAHATLRGARRRTPTGVNESSMRSSATSSPTGARATTRPVS